MKMKMKIVFVAAMLVLVFVIAACGKKDAEVTETDNTEQNGQFAAGDEESGGGNGENEENGENENAQDGDAELAASEDAANVARMIEEYYGTVTALKLMIENVPEESGEGLADWVNSFRGFHSSVKMTVEILVPLSVVISEEHTEDLESLVAALTLLDMAMTEIENTLDAALQGDDEAMRLSFMVADIFIEAANQAIEGV